MIFEPHDNILKAQNLYREMTACETPDDFRKVFNAAIQRFSLDEFHPVVVRAQLAAALHRLGSEGPAEFEKSLVTFFALKPSHFHGIDIQSLADVMEKSLESVITLLLQAGYSIDSGRVTPPLERKTGHG